MSQPIIFADILKEVNKVTSLSGQSMLLVNGSGEISKTDSSVFFPLMITDTMYDRGDLNNLTTTGIYLIRNLWSNRPSEVNTAGATVLVSRHSTGYVSQTLFAITWQSGQGIYYRSMEPDGWKDWHKVTASVVNTVS